MLDDRITDGKALIAEISAFGEKLEERRRFERKTLFWAATVDVRGQRFEGTIIDFSAGGARIRFDAAVAEGEVLTLALKQLAELGAKVVWRRQGEAGLQFLLAPEEVAARVQGLLEPGPGSDGPAEASAPAATALPSAAPPAAKPAAPVGAGSRRRTRLAWTALGMAALAGGAIAMGRSGQGAAPLLPVTIEANDQHSCNTLMGRVNGATNAIDFDLRVASAVSAKCLDINHLVGANADDLNRRMVQAAKRPVR